MDFKPTAKHKVLTRRVSRLINDYSSYMPWLWEWEGEVVAADVHEKLPEVAMSVVNYNYLIQSQVRIHPPALDLDDDELELTVLHELGHVLMTEVGMVIYNLAKAPDGSFTKPQIWTDAEERLCWRFAKTVKRLHDKTKNRS